MSPTKLQRLKEVAFLVAWTTLVALFAWLGFDRLQAADETGSFGYIWYGTRQDNLPWLFSTLKAFLMIWTGVVSFMTAVGCLWIIVLTFKAFR